MKVNVVIPDQITIDGIEYKVTSIAEKAFENNIRLTKITIPAKVNRIGNFAFYGCEKLKNITIKTRKLTGERVGKGAFSFTSPKVTVKVPGSKLKSYTKILRARYIKAKIKK